MKEYTDMNVKELVAELISNAYENGYEDEIREMSDEELAYDLLDPLEDASYEEALAAVIDFRRRLK